MELSVNYTFSCARSVPEENQEFDSPPWIVFLGMGRMGWVFRNVRKARMLRTTEYPAPFKEE
jgi:hypothetical protein